MRTATLLLSFIMLWMALQPCTDIIMSAHEHAQQVVDPAHTTGESPFHEDTCPVFCACTCCATLTVTHEFTQLVLRVLVVPQGRPVQLAAEQVKHIAFALWRPPRQAA
ncbi:DUF6660 family protein [Pontibacter flavimaris]|uniref:Uncharacterized protein n=1 Tax=Pontibacter flavimaris TaxID=1797110 RepID=A0A1Q5PH31_9BACT|nr:DUF6660 family protein [Pontibacter flavimaris]OKL41540.1 hypothetical protein A3841_10865 [Pontibacter flavimaris]